MRRRRLWIVCAAAMVGTTACSAGSGSDESRAAQPTSTGKIDSQCPGGDPLAVARSFVTAINGGDEAWYSACVLPGAEKDPNSLLHRSDWVSVARSVNAQLDDEFERAPGLYSFGSPDGPHPPPSTPFGPEYWIDPNGRLDVNVALQSDGRYWVTGVSIEFHN